MMSSVMSKAECKNSLNIFLELFFKYFSNSFLQFKTFRAKKKRFWSLNEIWHLATQCIFLYTLIAISFLSILSLVPFLWCSSSKRSISLIVTIFMMITMMMTTMTMMIISIIMIYILMKSPTPYLLREMGCLDHWLNELLIDLVPQRSPCHTNYYQSVKTFFFKKERTTLAGNHILTDQL